MVRIQRVCPLERRFGELILSQPLLNQREVVEGVAGLRVECGRGHQGPAGIGEATQFEEYLPLEGPVDRNFTCRLQAASDQEKSALEVV